MAAEGCLHAGLYQQALQAAGFEPVLWSEAELQVFMQLVYRIKAGDNGADINDGMQHLALALENAGAEVLVAGCTEVPLHLSAADTRVPLLSSTDLLVARTIALAQRQSPLNN